MSLCVCFDFDGVIGNSVDEMSTSGWLHAKEVWPDLPLGESPEPFLEAMRQVRPVVETGWESTLLIRVLHEAGADSSIIERILQEWSTMSKECLAKWELAKEDLIAGFGQARDKWIQSDLEDWLQRTKPYDEVPRCICAMLAAGTEVFVITTKQRRFTEMLLRKFRLDIPASHLFALEDGPKPAVLRRLKTAPNLSGRTFHFIEDKYTSLLKVIAEADLDDIVLHLADWGDNTEHERSEARASDRISLLSFESLRDIVGDA